ncbi:MAG: transporter substrate-binding domain-containing protein [Pseudomonadota bacterium]
MKKTGLLFVIIVLCAMDSGLACELTVRVPETPYPPFFMVGEKGGQAGLSIELAEALLKEAGCTPVYKPIPWKRALAYLETGELQMMLNVTPTDERKVYADFIGPQLDESVVLVISRGSDLKITCLDDFKNLPKAVGVELGKVYGEAFENKRANDQAFASKIEIGNTMESSEKKLAAGRLSAFLGYGYNVYHRIKTDPLYKNFTVHPMIVHQDMVYFAFSRKGVPPEMLQRLQKAYDSAEEKGLLEKIRQSYRSE